MELETIISGYRVYLDTDIDGQGCSGCWIEQGPFSASLEYADATGCLDDAGAEMPVSRSAIEAIRRWAEKHGY